MVWSGIYCINNRYGLSQLQAHTSYLHIPTLYLKLSICKSWPTTFCDKFGVHMHLSFYLNFSVSFWRWLSVVITFLQSFDYEHLLPITRLNHFKISRNSKAYASEFLEMFSRSVQTFQVRHTIYIMYVEIKPECIKTNKSQITKLVLSNRIMILII